MLPVPPKASITPKRKQSFYDFANEVYNYGNELYAFKDSPDFDLLEESEKLLIKDELSLIDNLNEFQVNQIKDY